MITLSTLHKATAQEVFDQVATHLLKQGEKSLTDGDTCCYRHGNLKCAAGCLISDEEYDGDKMEGLDWGHMQIDGLAPSDHGRLIEALQECHDSTEVGGWRHELREIAKEFNLNTEVLA